MEKGQSKHQTHYIVWVTEGCVFCFLAFVPQRVSTGRLYTMTIPNILVHTLEKECRMVIVMVVVRLYLVNKHLTMRSVNSRRLHVIILTGCLVGLLVRWLTISNKNRLTFAVLFLSIV